MLPSPSLSHLSSSLFWLDLKTEMQNLDFLVFVSESVLLSKPKFDGDM